MLKLFALAQVFISEKLDEMKNEEGQTMAEYAVVLAVITLGIVGVMIALSGGISNALNQVKSHLP